MSGTLNSIHNNASFALNLHYKAMSRLQEQAYTGSRINRSSDDPSAANRILGLKSQERSLGDYMDKIFEASDVLEVSSSVLNEISSVVSDTKVRLTQIFSDIYTEKNRQELAEQVNNILEQVVSSANTKHLNQYLFGGGKTTTEPYSVKRTNGEITSVTYQGSEIQRNIEIAPGVESNAYYVGQDIFSSNNRSTLIFTGDTGAAAGSGTSNIRGDCWLTVTDDGGGSYDLSIDDGNTKVNVAAAADITNIAVTNSNGDVLYVNASNITGTGVDMVNAPGTCDIFSTLISVRSLLKNERNLSENQLNDCQEVLTDSLDEVKNFLVENITSIGSKIGFLDGLKDSLESIKFNTEDESAMLQEADIAQVAIDLSRREVLYEMSLSVTGRLMSVSLLDFI